MKESIDVLAPKEWMKGWEGRYEKEGELRDDKLLNFFPHPMIQLLDRIIEERKIDESLSVLELGCGSGKDSCFLGTRGFTVDAIDALPKAIDLANRRSRLMGVDSFVRFHIDDVLKLQILPEKYDIIVAIQTLQYLFENAIPRLRDILQGVKPGGFFVYSGNIPPHFDTEPPIRFISEEEILSELDNWIIHSVVNERLRIKEDDIRGFLYVLAEKSI